MMFYLKANIYYPEGLKPNSVNSNLKEENKYENQEKEDWRNKLSIQSEMDMNVVHWYSPLKEKLSCITYKALGVKLTVTPLACDGCDRSKEKAHSIRNKTYTIASTLGDRFF